MKIRLAKSTVVPISVIEDEKGFRKYRFGEIPRGPVFELEEKGILNIDDIDMKKDFVDIVTPERVSFGVFSCITFTRDIDLPK